MRDMRVALCAQWTSRGTVMVVVVGRRKAAIVRVVLQGPLYLAQQTDWVQLLVLTYSY
jgi:hypothetical protein